MNRPAGFTISDMEMIAWITRLMEVDMGPDAAARVVALTGAGAQMVRVFAARVAP